MRRAFRRTGPLTQHDRIYLNGRFLSQPLTGVQRYAAEMIRAIDRLLAGGNMPEPLRSARWTLLVPGDVKSDLPLEAIGRTTIGAGAHPQVWDQLPLARAARDGVLLSFANSGPLLHRRHLVVIHDAAVFRHPEFYGRAYATFHRTLGRMLARTATLGTVSPFSQRELSSIFGKAPSTIGVFPNGADHLARVLPDETVIDELGLRVRPFFLALGSMTGNKNVGLAVEALSRLGRPDATLVVVGSRGAIFKSVGIEDAKNVIQAGRLSDERIAALYAHAAAFVFPSIYEGFGIPPLEAMTFGSPVLASTAEAVRETCGEAASYFAPGDADGLATLMAAMLAKEPSSVADRERQKAQAALFTWEGSVQRLLKVIPSL